MSKTIRYGQTHRPTAAERIRQARALRERALREGERVERIGQRREHADFARMMRENQGTL